MEWWRKAFSIASRPLSYEEILSRLFDELNSELDLEIYYLYLLIPETKRLRLEYVKEYKSPKLSEEELFDIHSSSVESMMYLSRFDFALDESLLREKFVDSPRGKLLSIPLLCDEDFVGLLQAGPVNQKKKIKTLRSFSQPLSYIVKFLKERENLRMSLEAERREKSLRTRLLSSAFSLSGFLDFLLSLALQATKSEAGFVALLTGKELRLEASRDVPEELLLEFIRGEDKLWKREPETAALVMKDFDFLKRWGVKSILAVPLVKEDEIIGIFALLNFKQTGEFTEHSLLLLDIYLEQIRLILENERLLVAFQDRYLETLLSLSRVLDVRRPETKDHSVKTARVALEIANKLDLSSDFKSKLEKGALLHDIGMCGIVEIQKGLMVDFYHPILGSELVKVLPEMEEVAQFIREHHEWYDGWGYPDGKKGEEISLGGRILALAEFVTESAERGEDFISAVRERAGRQFDPLVVRAFLEAWEEKGEKIFGGAYEI